MRTHRRMMAQYACSESVVPSAPAFVITKMLALSVSTPCSAEKSFAVGSCHGT